MIAVDWDNDKKITYLAGQFPLLLHLKNGRYAIKGDNIYYNIDLRDDDIKIVIYPTALDGYKEVEDQDRLPPNTKLRLKWSLEKKSYYFVPAIMSIIIFFLIATNVAIKNDIVKMKREIDNLTFQMYKNKKVEYILPNLPQPNLNFIVNRIDVVVKAIKDVAYIRKVSVNNGKLTFKIECFDSICYVPLADAQKQGNGYKISYQLPNANKQQRRR